MGFKAFLNVSSWRQKRRALGLVRTPENMSEGVDENMSEGVDENDYSFGRRYTIFLPRLLSAGKLAGGRRGRPELGTLAAARVPSCLYMLAAHGASLTIGHSRGR